MHRSRNPRYAGASILIVNGNFGCGSSREHAPQAIQRWGIRADRRRIVLGDLLRQLGRARHAVPHRERARRRGAAVGRRSQPQAEVTVSVGAQTVEVNGKTYQASIPAGAREAFTAGTWDATGLLLDDFDQVRDVAQSLPYVIWFLTEDQEVRRNSFQRILLIS